MNLLIRLSGLLAIGSGLGSGVAGCTTATDKPQEATREVAQRLYYPTGTPLWTENGNVVPMCWHEDLTLTTTYR
jgi:hypothetical protein